MRRFHVGVQLHPQDTTLDGYVLANLTAEWRATPSLSLIARVENLLDEDYRPFPGTPTMGRMLIARLRYDF